MKKILILLLLFFVFGCSKKIVKQEIIKPNQNQIRAERIIKQAEKLQEDKFANIFLMLAKNSYEKKEYLNAINFADVSIDVASQKPKEEIVKPIEVEKEETISKEIIYSVVKGDSLWTIACKFYDDPFKWKLIYEANENINEPNLVYPCQKLIIPMEVKQ